MRIPKWHVYLLRKGSGPNLALPRSSIFAAIRSVGQPSRLGWVCESVIDHRCPGCTDELELIGCRIDALPTGSQVRPLTFWWRGGRPATEDWTAFFHITTSANNAQLVGQLDHAITDHEYPPTVWAAGEVVLEQVQISAAKLQAASYAVWMRMYAPAAQMRAAVEAAGVVVDNRALLLEVQLAPGL